jgi:hypothetical protein
MTNFDLTDAQVAPLPWAEFIDAMSGLSDTALLEIIQEGLAAFADEHLSFAASGSELPNLNAVCDTDFATAAPTTSMGELTNFTNQINYSHQVSKPQFGRQH